MRLNRLREPSAANPCAMGGRCAPTLARGLLALALLSCAIASAQTLRWASQGDLQTTDPHSQNELPPTSFKIQHSKSS